MGALERAAFSEELARLPGLLQGIDPRTKVLAALWLLLAVSLSRHLIAIIVIYAITLLVARLSRLPLAGFALRVWLGIPLFAGMMVLPSVFLLPGRPLVTLAEFPTFRLVVSDSGLSSALLVVARVGTSVSLVLLLVSTTRWTELLRGLRVLRVPASFLVVLGMTYRYLFLFLHAANNLFLARRSRTVGVVSGHQQRRWVGGAAGVLVSRSVKVSGEVLLAMQARGFDGEIRVAAGTKMRDEDWLLLTLGVVLGSGILLLDQGLF